MAFDQTPGWDLSFTFRDNNGNTARTSVIISGLATFVEAQGAAASLIAPLQAISNARIQRYSITRTWENDSTAAIAPESEVERKLAITLRGQNAWAKATLQVPSPVFSLEIDGTDVVPLTNTLVTNLVNVLVGKLPPPLQDQQAFVTAAGVDIQSVERVQVKHRRT